MAFFTTSYLSANISLNIASLICHLMNSGASVLFPCFLFSVSYFSISLPLLAVSWKISSVLSPNLLILHLIVSHLLTAHIYWLYTSGYVFISLDFCFFISLLFFPCLLNFCSWYMSITPYFIYLRITIITLKFRCIYFYSSGRNARLWKWHSSYVLKLLSVSLYLWMVVSGRFVILRCRGLSG